MKPNAAFLCKSEAAENISRVYAKGREQQVRSLTRCLPAILTSDNLADHQMQLSGIQVLFSTWGMPCLSPGDLNRMPNLKALFYAAGTVKYFARPFLERGVTVCSAWQANAVPVAEFTTAQILLACKGYFQNTTGYHTSDSYWNNYQGPGVYATPVAVIGAGAIGRLVISMLKPYRLNVLVVDPYLPQSEADALGVEGVSLEQAFQRSQVVSNHLPNLDSLKQVLNAPLFRSLPRGGVFINTGRGAQVHEADLIQVLRERPDLFALLDVTHPEPVHPGSEFFKLPNVLLSSHIAGAINNERVRLADFMIEEFKRWEQHKPLQYEVTPKMLETMA